MALMVCVMGDADLQGYGAETKKPLRVLGDNPGNVVVEKLAQVKGVLRLRLALVSIACACAVPSS